MNLVTLKNTKLQKSITFLYTNNKQLKIEVKKIQFIIVSKNCEIISLIKYVQITYVKYYKILTTEIKLDLDK